MQSLMWTRSWQIPFSWIIYLFMYRLTPDIAYTTRRCALYTQYRFCEKHNPVFIDVYSDLNKKKHITISCPAFKVKLENIDWSEFARTGNPRCVCVCEVCYSIVYVIVMINRHEVAESWDILHIQNQIKDENKRIGEMTGILLQYEGLNWDD